MENELKGSIDWSKNVEEKDYIELKLDVPVCLGFKKGTASIVVREVQEKDKDGNTTTKEVPYFVTKTDFVGGSKDDIARLEKEFSTGSTQLKKRIEGFDMDGELYEWVFKVLKAPNNTPFPTLTIDKMIKKSELNIAAEVDMREEGDAKE